MPLGQAEAHMVRNTTGSQIAKGKVVYINGATGQRPTIALADADSESASSGTFGVTAEAIDNNDTGFVFISGYIKGINTNTIAPGSALWLDTVPGNFTTTKRVAPVHTVLVGYSVTQANNGTIFVKVVNGQELGELHDVDVTSPVNGSLLRYNSTSAIWVDAQADSASIASNAIKNIHITNSAVNTSKLADSTVTALKIATATIANANIANATITAAKLVDSTITGAKIATSTINTENITNSAVTGAKTNFAGRAGDATRLLGAQSDGTTDTVQVGAGLTLSGGVLSATGGGGGGSGVITGIVSGEVAYGIGADSLGGESALFYSAANDRLSIGGETSPTATLQVKGAGTTTGETVLVENSAGTDRFAILDNGQINLYNTAVTNSQSGGTAYFINQTTNGGIVLAINGTGPFSLDFADGTSSGGNSRGQNAIDLQVSRTLNTRVASGNRSVLIGGTNNGAASQDAGVFAGDNNAIGNQTNNRNVILGGTNNSISGDVAADNAMTGNGNIISTDNASNNFLTGLQNQATSVSGISHGRQALSYMWAQYARSNGNFGTRGDNQNSVVGLRREITGTAQTELFLDGSSLRAILPSGSPTTTNRLWNAKIQLVAIVTTRGNGTTDSVAVGKSFIGNYAVGIKRIGSNTSLVGAVQDLHAPQYDSGMSTCAVTIDADDTNEALRIRFTPPTGAGSTTVMRVLATVYLTEIGY